MRKEEAAGMREWKVVKITRENEARFYDCIPAACRMRMVQKGGFAVGAADTKGEPVGALVGEAHKEAVEISSIYVKPKSRRQGIGTGLLDAVKQLLASRGGGRAAISYPYPRMREMDQFLISCGFRPEEEGNRVYFVAVNDIQGMGFLKKPAPVAGGSLVPLSRMADEDRVRWLRRFGRDLPEDLDPRKCGGELLAEESLVFMGKGQVSAFAVLSRLEDGTLYLASLYSKRGAVKAMVPLLQQVLAGLIEKHPGEVLCFAAATRAGRGLADRLCGEKEDCVDIQTMRTSVWHAGTQEEGEEMDFHTPESLMPRLGGLSNRLNGLGIENDILMSVDTFPAVLAETGGRQLRFTYVPAGTAGEGRFVLNITWTVSGQDGQVEGLFGMLSLCQQFNQESLFASSVYDPARNQAMVRCAVPEMGGIPEEEYISYVIGLFTDSIRQFEELMESRAQERS